MEKKTTGGRGGVVRGGGRENDIVIHPTLCHKLRVKDTKLQAHSLPWVKYCSSNKVNNCFTVMHTLVLLEAKLPSCCSWYCGTLCRQGRARKLLQRSHSILTKSGTQETQSLVVIYIKWAGCLSWMEAAWAEKGVTGWHSRNNLLSYYI